jgi:tetratricopeptide (TPR) repeat protein
MKSLSASLLLLCLFTFAKAQQPAAFTVTPVADGLYHLYYDSSTAKSTVLEFDKFIVLLEVPVKNEGGGATNLKDHLAGGNKVLAALKSHFPNKPLRYVLHTHWHPHSISSVKPFISNGVTLVTTRTNFEKLKEFVEPATLKAHEKNIQFVDSDSLVIRDKKNHLVAYRFLKRDFQSTPTTEYLYFYLPKYKALHSGCMFFRMAGQVEGREILNDRVKDLNHFLETKHLSPTSFIRYNGDTDEPQAMVPYEKFHSLVSQGISSSEISTKYFSLPESDLPLKQDSLLQVLVRNTVPVSMVNSAAYASLRENKLLKALSLAQIQVLLNPSDANAWDTLGEVYFFLGQKEMAAHYEKQSLKINPAFSVGGEKVWQTNLETFRKNWK